MLSFNKALVATIDGYQFHLCVFQTFHASVLIFFLFLGYISLLRNSKILTRSYEDFYTYILNTDLLPASGDQQRFSHSVCKLSLVTKTSNW